MNAVHFVVPDGIDEPARPSGGNTYDRHLRDGLRSVGWPVHEHPVGAASLAGVLERIPDGADVLLDGLIASNADDVLVPAARRLRLVVLLHMPLFHARERAVLSAAAAIVTTSEWSRGRLLEAYALSADRVHVAHPGVEAAEQASGSPAGERLLCVAAVIPGKGHDVLLAALARMTDLPWRCVCVGSVSRDPEFAAGLSSPDGRVSFTGALSGADLDRAYAGADLVVLASRAETYGMVLTEALARGLPVVASDVGGVTEALGHGADGTRPGLLVAPEDPAALAAALRAWLGDPELRGRLRGAARERRKSLPRWSATTSVIARVLEAAGR